MSSVRVKLGSTSRAGMAELADAADSKSAEGNLVGVRPPLPAPKSHILLYVALPLGIVEVFAKAGYDVTFVARSPEKIDAVRAAIGRSLEKAVQRGKLSEDARDAALKYCQTHGSDVAPGPSGRCIITVSSQRSNLSPTASNVPTMRKPAAR